MLRVLDAVPPNALAARHRRRSRPLRRARAQRACASSPSSRMRAKCGRSTASNSSSASMTSSPARSTRSRSSTSSTKSRSIEWDALLLRCRSRLARRRHPHHQGAGPDRAIQERAGTRSRNASPPRSASRSANRSATKRRPISWRACSASASRRAREADRFRISASARAVHRAESVAPPARRLDRQRLGAHAAEPSIQLATDALAAKPSNTQQLKEPHRAQLSRR